MKKIFFAVTVIAAACLAAPAQSKSNDAISKQIKALGSSKTIELTYDQNSNVSKLRAVTENFQDSGKTGVQAMNFAIGFMYPGRELARAPENLLLTFWVLTKKPRFASNHNLTLNYAAGMLDLGPARYVAKPREDMEYLNFEISRDDLAKMIGQPNPSLKLGEFQLTLTPGQQKAISDLLILSDPARDYFVQSSAM
jgi:hypothetical protein